MLCGTSGSKKLCMVPCHSCHIYGIWTSRSKKVWGILKSHQLGGCGDASHKRGTLFIEKAGSHFVILLYCETLLLVLLGIYCKRFDEIPLFTILLLFYVFEVDKVTGGVTKSATESVLLILTLNGLFQKIFYVFYFTIGNSRQNKASPLDFPHNCVTHFRNFKA